MLVAERALRPYETQSGKVDDQACIQAESQETRLSCASWLLVFAAEIPKRATGLHRMESSGSHPCCVVSLGAS